MNRHVTRVCSDCWYRVRPDQYFPNADVWDVPCCSCGNVTQTARVARWEAQSASYALFADPMDRPACCRVTEKGA